MATPPVVPNWAEGVDPPTSPVVIEPNDNVKSTGWIPTVPPPAGYENWRARQVGRCLDHLYGHSRLYTDLAEAVGDTVVGERCLVFENELSGGPGVEDIEKDTGITVTNALRENIAVASDLVIYGAGDNDPVQVPRDLDQLQSGGTPAVTYARTNSGEVQKVITDGTYVIALYGPLQYVECWLMDGTQQWVKNAGGQYVYDICMRNGVVYAVTNLLAGTDFTATKNVHALDASDGTQNWAYQHTANNDAMTAVCTNGRQVFFGSSAASSYASLATHRALRASDGFDFSNEGGTGQDFTGLAWDSTAAVVASAGVMDCDGWYLVQGNSSAGAVQLRSAGAGVVEWAILDLAGLTPVSVSIDQDYVFAAYSDLGSPAEGVIKAHDKRNGRVAWVFKITDETAGTAGTAFSTVRSDGQKVYAVAEDESLVWRFSRGNKGADAFQRVDRTGFMGGIVNLALQPERAL